MEDAAPKSRPALSRASRICLALAAAAILTVGLLARDALLLLQTTVSGADALRVSVDSASALRVSIDGLQFSYPSSLPAELCSCALSLGASDALPLSLNDGGACATLTHTLPRLDVALAAKPSGALSNALLAFATGGGGDAKISCDARVLSFFTHRVEVSLPRPTAAANDNGDAGSLGNTPLMTSAPTAVPAALANSLGAFESSTQSFIDVSRALRALPFPVGEVQLSLPGIALALRSAARPIAALIIEPVNARVSVAAGAPSLTVSIITATSSAALGDIAPSVALNFAAAATGLPTSLISGLLNALGFDALGSANPVLALSAAGFSDSAALSTFFTSAHAECTPDVAPAPWVRAIFGNNREEKTECSTDPLVVIRFGEPYESPSPAPSVNVIFSAPGATFDASVPRAAIDVTVSLVNASFLAQGLYKTLSPYVGEYSAPISVSTAVDVAWRTATPSSSSPGSWVVDPPRATDTLTLTSCGRGLAKIVWADVAASVLTASALFELPNAVGCINAFLKEYRLGPFAGVPAERGALIRDFADTVRPRGSVRLTLPSIGAFSLPLAISTRVWLAGALSSSPTTASVVFSSQLHNASVFPGVFALTDAGSPLARAYGISSHSGEVVTAVNAGVDSGCAARNSPGFPVDCAAWEALWRSSGYLGVDGLLLSGDCPDGDASTAHACVAVQWASDKFGLFNFQAGTPKSFAGLTSSNIDKLRQTPSGRSPQHVSVDDPRSYYFSSFSGMAGWELRTAEGWEALSVTAALFNFAVTAYLNKDGQPGWVPGSDFGESWKAGAPRWFSGHSANSPPHLAPPSFQCFRFPAFPRRAQLFYPVGAVSLLRHAALTFSTVRSVHEQLSFLSSTLGWTSIAQP
jgi:hypothetical protein